MPAQQLDLFIPWLMKETGAKKFYLPSAEYIWPHVMNKKVREIVTANGGTIEGEEYFPRDHADYGKTVEKIMSSGTEVVFNTIVPPGLMRFLEQLDRLNMYIAYASNGIFQVVKNLGVIEPNESVVSARQATSR